MIRLLIDFFGVGRFSLSSGFRCGDVPEREEREDRLVRRGEEADWRKANDEEGLRAELGVSGAFGAVGVRGPLVLERRSCDSDICLMVLLRSSWSLLAVARDAAEGERADMGDFGGRSMLAVPRPRQGQLQKERLNQNVCAFVERESVWGVCRPSKQCSDVASNARTGFASATAKSRPRQCLRANQTRSSIDIWGIWRLR